VTTSIARRRVCRSEGATRVTVAQYLQEFLFLLFPVGVPRRRQRCPSHKRICPTRMDQHSDQTKREHPQTAWRGSATVSDQQEDLVDGGCAGQIAELHGTLRGQNLAQRDEAIR